MDHKPPPAPDPRRGGTRRGARRRHPAARSRLVAGMLSAVLFLGLGAGMAANQTGTTVVYFREDRRAGRIVSTTFEVITPRPEASRP